MRTKSFSVIGIAVVGAVALYCATQTWVTLFLSEGAAAHSVLEITGQQLNPTLSPVAIAALASALALTIAGKGFRRVLGVLVALLGAGVVAISAAVLQVPERAAAGNLADATGLIGSTDLISDSSTTAFIAFTVVAGGALVMFGVLVLVFGGGWKRAGRKYESDSGRAPAQSGEPDRISEWEALNEGEDPTQSPTQP